MMTITRGAFAATLGLLMLVSTGAPAHAQDNESAGDTVIGAPALSNFSLPGTRTTPPAETQAVPPPAPPSVQQQPAESAPAPAPRAAPVRSQPPQSVQAAPQPVTAPPVEAAPESTLLSDLPSLATPAPVQVPPTLPAAEPETALWQSLGFRVALGAALLLLLGLFAYQRSRARHAIAAPVVLQRAAMPAPAAPAPAPAPVPARDEARPWLEMEFRPARMVATDTDAAVHYELAVRNVGGAPAARLRFEARMFNASTEQGREIGAFFATPAKPGNADAVTLQPGQTLRLSNRVTMRRDQVREVKVQGRPLFVPTVALTMFYEWGDGQVGQTSHSYVVGVETPASDKMGPFRLDLGPRIYRSVGQRALELARVV